MSEVEQRPRVLFVGRNRYTLPLPDWLAKKWDALERQIEYRVLASAANGSPLADERFRLVPPARPQRLDGLLFYLRLPLRVRGQIRDFRPDAIIASDPYVGAASMVGRALAPGLRPQVILEVHGDWRTFTRLYGSPRRRFFSPVADLVSRAAVRRGDAVRALSRYTESLVEDVRGVPVAASFPTYTDLSAFTARPIEPLPERPTALFVGMLEAYKNVDGLAVAWREVAARLPGRPARAGREGGAPQCDRRARRRPPRPGGARSGAVARGSRRAARRSDGARAPVTVGGARTCRDRGVRARPRGRREPGRRHSGPRPRRRRGKARRTARRRAARRSARRGPVRPRGSPSATALAAAERYRAWHTTPAEFAAQVRGLVEASLRDAGEIPGERPRVLIVADAAHGAPCSKARPMRRSPRCARSSTTACSVAPSAASRPAGPSSRRDPVLLVRRWPGPLDSLVFYGSLPFRIASLVRRFKPSRRDRGEPVHRFLRARGVRLPSPSAVARDRDARRLAGGDAARGITDADPAGAVRRPGRAVCAAARRRAARALAVHGRARRAGGRRAAARVVPRVHRSFDLHEHRACPAAGAADGAVRGDAGAEQERRRARAGMARRRGRGPGRAARDRWQVGRCSTSSTACATTSPSRLSTTPSSRRSTLLARWTSRPASFCPRAPRDSVAC